MNPMVSVVITTYKRDYYLKRAVNSVLKQIYDDFELIIVDDYPSGKTIEVLKQLNSSKIRFFQHPKNQGLPAARNTGLRHAKGKYVAYLDDDDEWRPDKLERQTSLMENNEMSAVIYCGATIVGSNGEYLSENHPTIRGNIRSKIKEQGLYTIPSSCLFRRSVLEDIDGFDETLPSHIDHDIWLKLASGDYFADYVNESLVRVYQHENNQMTTDVKARVKATDMLCNKWLPRMAGWWDRQTAQKYCDDFHARVMNMLGWRLNDQNRRMLSLQCFLTAVKYQPKNMKHYYGLLSLVFGKTTFRKFVEFTKKFSPKTT